MLRELRHKHCSGFSMMTMLLITGSVWVAVAFAFVLSLGIAAARPVPQVEEAMIELPKAA